MEFGGNLFSVGKDQNGNRNIFSWDSWQTTTSNNNSNSNINNNSTLWLVNGFNSSNGVNVNRHHDSGGLANALMFLPQNDAVVRQRQRQRQQQSHPYVGDGSHVHPDPHLMCLKLGKRHYFEDASGGGVKRGKGGGGADVKAVAAAAATTTVVPRCQVEGCHVALLNAKEYHRRHKVCEMHSKAPKVVVLGMEQRFCQQCSRFHVVSEFDDSKRSCRRRLAGHNERRRKSSHDSVARNSSQGGCALSLLSSRSDSWLSSSPDDLSMRCSAALRELIAENRAAIMARHFVSDHHRN
ncbi:hypothetical protein RJT34_16261 [Clitoria ternatea]|uniref:SBP-type domain-containing protein n=1 Tax=Clitoria ternatea TaxID=43366 RepID=A0AAN9J858_CLITE